MLLYARWFDPATFGTIAIFQLFVIFSQMMGASSLEPVFISTDVKKHVRLVRLINEISSVALALIFFLVTYLFFFIEGSTLLLPITAYSIAVYFNVKTALPSSILKIEKKFFLHPLYESISDLFLIVFVYFYKDSSSAIIILSLRYMLSSILKYALCYFSINKSYKRIEKDNKQDNSEIFKSLSHFFKHQVSFNVMSHFARNIDIFLVNNLFGKEVLGLYDYALKLCRYPTMIIVAGLHPVIQPILKNENNTKVISRTFLYMTFFIGLIASIFSVIITDNATEIIILLFGEKWLVSATYLSILGYSIIPNMLSFTAGYFQALNRPEFLTKVSIFTLISFISCLSIAFLFDNSIQGILIAVVVSNFLSYFYSSYTLYIVALGNRLLNYIFLYSVIGLFLISLMIFFT